jgi:hypothetical protein
LDGYAASHRAVRELKADGVVPTDTKQRSSKDLNNLVEQDHRSIKQRIVVMLGFKQFRNAAVTIAGIELMHRIRKGSSGYDALVFEVGPRPQSGMQSSGHEGGTMRQGTRIFGLPLCTRTSWGILGIVRSPSVSPASAGMSARPSGGLWHVYWVGNLLAAPRKHAAIAPACNTESSRWKGKNAPREPLYRG